MGLSAGSAALSKKDDSKDEKGQTDSQKGALSDGAERDEGDPDGQEGSANVFCGCHDLPFAAPIYWRLGFTALSLFPNSVELSERSLIGFVRFVVEEQIPVTNIIYAVQLPPFDSFLPGLALHDGAFDLV